MLNIAFIKNKFGSEFATILLCCRVFFGTASAEDLKLFVEQNDVAWDKFFRLLFLHQVRPIVYKAIYKLELPEEVKGFMQRDRTELARQSLRQAIEMERIIMLLKKCGITAMPYKGTAYSKQFFGDLISRESSDIDLFIKKEDIEKINKILKQDGYLPELEDIYQYLGDKYPLHYKDYNFNKYKANVREFHVEMHWAIAEDLIGVTPKINNYIVNNCNQLRFTKAEIDTLSAEAHFAAILIHHALKDNFVSLKNVVDLSQAFCDPEIRASGFKLQGDFEKMDLMKPLAVASILSSQLMGIAVRDIDTQNCEDIAEYFSNQVCGNCGENQSYKRRFLLWMKGRAMLYNSGLNRGAFYIKCFSYRFIPGSKDFRMIWLPKPLFFIYYLVKPFRTLIAPMDGVEEKKRLIPADKSVLSAVAHENCV